MTDNNTEKNTARRRLLKSIVAGGGVLATGKLLPENWARPVVQSVLLPAHAQTSPVSFDGFFDTGELLGDAGGSQPGSILDMFVSPAHAQVAVCNTVSVSRIQINVSGGNAAICLTTFDASFPGSTSVNESTRELADAAISGTGAQLVNMQVSSDASRIEGDIDHCGPFVASRSGGSFSCMNSASSDYLSSPYRNKA